MSRCRHCCRCRRCRHCLVEWLEAVHPHHCSLCMEQDCYIPADMLTLCMKQWDA